MQHFFRDVNVGYADMIVGLIMLNGLFLFLYIKKFITHSTLIFQLIMRLTIFTQKYQPKGSVLLSQIILYVLTLSPKKPIADAYYWMKFAAAVYGWKLIYGYSFSESTTGLYKGFTGGDECNLKVV